MASDMTERRQRILKLVIQEYIESAPVKGVASETLLKKYKLQYSSATIRNELAALEDQGLLMQLAGAVQVAKVVTGLGEVVHRLQGGGVLRT